VRLLFGGWGEGALRFVVGPAGGDTGWMPVLPRRDAEVQVSPCRVKAPTWSTKAGRVTKKEFGPRSTQTRSASSDFHEPRSVEQERAGPRIDIYTITFLHAGRSERRRSDLQPYRLEGGLRPAKSRLALSSRPKIGGIDVLDVPDDVEGVEGVEGVERCVSVPWWEMRSGWSVGWMGRGCEVPSKEEGVAR